MRRLPFVHQRTSRAYEREARANRARTCWGPEARTELAEPAGHSKLIASPDGESSPPSGTALWPRCSGADKRSDGA